MSAVKLIFGSVLEDMFEDTRNKTLAYAGGRCNGLTAKTRNKPNNVSTRTQKYMSSTVLDIY
jgi:hypothetical protein